MNKLQLVRRQLDQVLALIVMALVLGISLVVAVGFISRFLGNPVSWSGELAGVGLAWLTFYGSALAAGRGAHIASPSILAMIPIRFRIVVTIICEAFTIGFFVVLAWTSLTVIEVLAGSRLVSLPFISQQLTQSAVFIGAVLFIVAELLRLPELFGAIRRGQVGVGVDEEDDVF